MRNALVLLVLVGLIGCRSEARLKGAPVNVTGKVSRGGRPLGGLMMVFQPLGDGHAREFPVSRDGTFRGDLASGEYAYFIANPATANSRQAPTGPAAKYFEADMARTVTIEPGTQLAIALD